MKMPESDSVSQELRGERTEQPQNTVALGERRGIVQFIKMFIFHNSHGCQSSDGAFYAVRLLSRLHGRPCRRMPHRPIARGSKREARAYCFLRSCNHYQTLSVSSSVTNLANDGGRWAARLSLCHRSWRPTGLHLVVRSSTRLWRRWWSSVRSNVLRRPANRFSAGAGAVPSWAGRLRAPSSQAGVRKVAALPALNELEDV